MLCGRHHAGAAGLPSLPPPAPLFVPNVPGLVSTVVPTRAPKRTPEPGDGRPSDISGISPVSDVAPYTSKGPSRDKSRSTTGVPDSTCDGPATEAELCPRAVYVKSHSPFGRGSNWTGNSKKAWSLSIRERSPAKRPSIDTPW